MFTLVHPAFVTKPHRWHSHRRHLGQTFAVPGALTPRSTATESYSGDEHLGEEEALPYRCDGCLGPLYVLPLRGLTECSLCDELYTDLAWCECVARACVTSSGMASPQSRLAHSSDYQGVVRWRLSGFFAVVGVAVRPPGHVKHTREPTGRGQFNRAIDLRRTKTQRFVEHADSNEQNAAKPDDVDPIELAC